MRSDPIISTAGQQFEENFTKNNDVFKTAFLSAVARNPLASAAFGAALTFKKYFDPTGVKPLVDARKQLFDKLNFLQRHDQTGVGAGVRSFAGSALGVLDDPTSLLYSVGTVPRLIGSASEGVAAAIGARTSATYAAKAAGAAVGGFLGGAAMTLPQSFSQLALAHTAYHTDFNSVDLIKSAFDNGVAGALIGGGGSLLWSGAKSGAAKIFNARGVRSAITAADTQAKAGVTPDITDHLQQAFNTARTDGSDVDTMPDGTPITISDKIDAATTAAKSQVDTLTDDIRKRAAKINKIWDKLPERLRTRPLNNYDIAKKLALQTIKRDDELTGLDNHLNKYAKTPHTTLREVQDMLDEPLAYHLMQADSAKFLDDMLNYRETGHLKVDTERLLGIADDEVEGGSPTKFEGRGISKRWTIPEFGAQVTEQEGRIAELEAIEGRDGRQIKHTVYEPTFGSELESARPKVLERLLKEHDLLDEAVQKRHSLLDDIDEGESVKKIVQRPPVPLNPQQVYAKMESTLRADKSSATGAIADRYRAIPEDKLFAEPPTPEEVKTEDLPELAQETYAKTEAILSDERKALPTWRTIYDNLADCLRM